jgi:uncharacterized protein
MISCDTNVLLHAANARSPLQKRADIFLRSHASNAEFVICELVLMELYLLLRNPAVVAEPRSAGQAAALCREYRRNPRWRVIDYPGGLMDGIWERAAREGAGRRTIFDARLALTLRHHGVTRFATGNVKHFAGYGFEELWDPLADAAADTGRP